MIELAAPGWLAVAGVAGEVAELGGVAVDGRTGTPNPGRVAGPGAVVEIAASNMACN